jgi:hypothetical protein
MNSPKDLLDWVIQTMQHKAERVKELVQHIGTMSPEAIMKTHYSARVKWITLLSVSARGASLARTRS